MTTFDVKRIAHIVVDSLRNGESPYMILQNHPELLICEKTLYNYIEAGIFSDWGFTTLTLKKAVKRRSRKPSKQVLKERNKPSIYNDRKYLDYQKFNSKTYFNRI